MAKLQIKSGIISTFGVIFIIMELFERLGLGKLIDSVPGKRDSSWDAFQYSEAVETLFCNYLSGDYCLEDINMIKD